MVINTSEIFASQCKISLKASGDVGLVFAVPILAVMNARFQSPLLGEKVCIVGWMEIVLLKQQTSPHRSNNHELADYYVGPKFFSSADPGEDTFGQRITAHRGQRRYDNICCR